MTTGIRHGDDLPQSPNYERRVAVRQNVAEFEPEQVMHAVETLAARPVIGQPSFVPSGLGNENWIVDTPAGRLLVKVGARNTPVAKWRGAAVALDLAGRAGLPVPRLVAWCEQAPGLSHRAVRIFEHIEGYPLGDPAGRCRASPRFWTELGGAIRRLHGIRAGGFTSRLDGSAPVFSTWDSYLDYRTGQIQERARASIWLDERALAPFWSALQAAAREEAPAICPTLTHRDLHVDNLLVSASSSLAAILDWDQAEGWDPVADFFKLQWLVFEEVPGAELAFLEGYGEPTRVHPHFRQRLRIASGIELVNMIAGARQDEGRLVGGLRLRLRGVAAETGWPDPSGIQMRGRSARRVP